MNLATSDSYLMSRLPPYVFALRSYSKSWSYYREMLQSLFNDTQQIGYLVNALRHESEWDTVCSTITPAQIQGNLTFRQACDELRFRCEATRANELMDMMLSPARTVVDCQVQHQYSDFLKTYNLKSWMYRYSSTV